jgi:hypothetical protein
MATKLFFLEDQRFVSVTSADFVEVCRLHLRDPGPYLVLAKGDLNQTLEQFSGTFEFRLELFSRFGASLARDESSLRPAFLAEATPDEAPSLFQHTATFSLMAAAIVPSKGGGGAIDPAVGGGGISFEHARAVLTARRASGSADVSAGMLSKVRMFALQADELVAAVIE